MTAAQRKTFSTLALTVGAPLLVALLAWGARKYDQSKVETGRFVADSGRREQRYARDSVSRLTDREYLERIDSRVGEIYCARVPAQQRAGCR